jgi:hypothetical protein
MERETLKVYVGILRSRVVTLFAAMGDMGENGGHRRQESLLCPGFPRSQVCY